MTAVPFAMAKRVSIGLLACAALAASGCGSADPPARAVIENDVGEWEFRRYQRVLDVEVWIPENPAIAHAASYVDGAAARSGSVEPADVVSAVVAGYARSEGVREGVAAFARRQAGASGYEVEAVGAAGNLAVRFRGAGEAWVLWPSSSHVVKIGGRERANVPTEVVEAYARHYPSSLREDPLAER